MSEVAGRKVVSIAGLEFTIKELTVAEVRALILGDGLESEVDVAGDFLFEEIRLRDLLAFTTLTKDQAEQMQPSQLAEVLDQCKAMNRHFFAMGERMSAPRVRP